ncbi:MAG: SNF1-interacting protein [Chaenotheca gracillima]|nr:MAG: SNF1-interacting protein [Chaenotheca gracillima]
MEGPRFRQLSDVEMDNLLPRLQVLARCSPEDKRMLILRLKHLGETVAVTGDGTNDAPALKAADIGFAMGIAGTEVAKEASSIILMDDNFASIVKAIMWGRAVNDAVAKFLQFQITVNITAVLLAFVSAVADPAMHSVLTAVQLLWVNLIMDTFAALALATDAPTTKILDRPPTPKRAALITVNMWKMITGQAVYQIVVTFVLHFAGAKILNYDVANDPLLQRELNTMVFNTFVWMQIFNEFNNRRLDNKLNIFEGVHRNWFFIGINAIMIGGQIMIVFVGGQAFQIVRLNGTQWAICILCAIFCLPWAVLLRFIPDRYAGSLFGFTGRVWDVVFGPVIRAYSTMMAPVGRFTSRVVRKMMPRKKVAADETELEPVRDEETAIKRDDEKHTPPTTPATHDSPLSPPPITITTAN